ncbi:hypothetical protein H261_15405 [Paramagnetospirillum caucaseum]|uniref:Uncharacterized protein n=1 Tax=Paramagnetospirillum caucaseum TaxID=1244869 RepID=M2Z3W4_9PROT|nr:hypothetical protein [Paramagnetospirillum caucaseum]EME69060.1 hypothetical protein H261_15405 [Paramagnetospirillum caucaseum]
MTRKTLGDLLNPAAYLQRLRAEADLQIKAARLDMDAQVERAKLEQGDRHHGDRMSLEVRKVESGELQAAGQLALGHDELDFKRQSAALTAQTSLEVARTQNAGALELSRQNHTQSLDMFREQLHGSIVEKTGNAVNESLLSALRRGEDSNRAFTSAMADIIKARKIAEISTAQTDHAERNRAAEREHEINMEVLKAQLSQGARDNGLDEADLMRRFAEWMAAEEK